MNDKEFDALPEPYQKAYVEGQECFMQDDNAGTAKSVFANPYDDPTLAGYWEQGYRSFILNR